MVAWKILTIFEFLNDNLQFKLRQELLKIFYLNMCILFIFLCNTSWALLDIHVSDECDNQMVMSKNTSRGEPKFEKNTIISVFFSNSNNIMNFKSNHNQESTFRKIPRDILNAIKIFGSDFIYIYSSPARLNWRSAMWLGTFTIATSFIYFYDQEKLDAVQRNRNGLILSPLIDVGEFFEPVGHMGVMNKYYFAALSVGYIFKINPLTMVAAQIIEAHLIAGAFKNVSKFLVGRKRPFEDAGPYDFSFNGGTSFPSGHAINIFQLATILSHHIQFLPFQIFAYFVATGIAFQRIYSENHWPSDVFFSAVFGTVVSKAVLSLHHKRSLKIRPTFSNELRMVGVKLEISW